MFRYSVLALLAALLLAVTLGLDVAQQDRASSGKEPIVFASMWSPGEVQQEAYDRLFAEFEREHPRYEVVRRWEGRWVLPAIRPRLLTQSELPDVINDHIDQAGILAYEGHLERLDPLLEVTPHPHDSARTLWDALRPPFRDRGHYELDTILPGGGTRGEGESGTYMLPANVWPILVFYNRVHYRELGLTEPRYWADFLDNCRRLRAAGYRPLTADMNAYNDYWVDPLMTSTLGTETLRSTLRGTGPRFDRDVRYRAVFQAIRDLHEPGWFTPGWNAGGSLPPFEEVANGRASQVITAIWIHREMARLASDPSRIDIRGFPVPLLGPAYLPGIERQDDRRRPVAHSQAAGYGLLRGRESREGSLALLRFLSRRDSSERFADETSDIPTVAETSWWEHLDYMRPRLASSWDLRAEGIRRYAPRWYKLVFEELYSNFFRINDSSDASFMTVDEFLSRLHRGTRRYLDAGGESGN